MSVRFLMYARKSSEQEDRQVQSIQSQIDELNGLVGKLILNVVEVLSESASAKRPGRLVFDQMVERIRKGEVNGIVVWNPDRLSRNSVDAGQLIYLFDVGLLEEIVTPYQTFKNTPNDKFLLSILWGQAKLDNDNKGINVKRGMKAKAQKGWFPGPAPLGYVNVYSKKYGIKILKKDQRKYEALRDLWLDILLDKYPADAWRDANRRWSDRYSKNLISHSAFYKMLTSSFYYGEFEFPIGSGNWYRGKHAPMITVDEFDRIQDVLGTKGKPRRNKHDFTYRGLLRCAECGCLITATSKKKFVKRDDGYKYYIYYHCTKKSKLHKCSQKPINKSDLEDEFSGYFSRIKVTKPFLLWAKKWNDYLDENVEKDVSDYRAEYEKYLSEVAKKKSDLLDLRLDKSISMDQFKEKMSELEVEKKKRSKQFKKLLKSIKSSGQDIVDDIEFAYRAKLKYVRGGKKVKRDMVSNLGSNFLLDDKKVAIQLKNSLLAIEKMNNGELEEKGRFELQKYADVLGKRPDLFPSNPSWLPLIDAFRNHEIPIDVQPESINALYSTLEIKQSFNPDHFAQQTLPNHHA